MKHRNGTRLLIATILATALLSSAAVEARAARFQSPNSAASSQVSSGKTKPTSGPMIGEPDSNGGPLPPKTGPYPTGGAGAGFTAWLKAWISSMWGPISRTLRLP